MALGLRPEAVIFMDINPPADRMGVERIRRFMFDRSEGFASLAEAADAVAADNPEQPRPRVSTPNKQVHSAESKLTLNPKSAQFGPTVKATDAMRRLTSLSHFKRSLTASF